jgi:hypothetical protein
MNRRRIHILGAFLAGLLLAGCEQGRENPPDVRVRIAHAAPAFGEIGFRREETQPTSLEYLASTNVTFDQDQYDFHVEVAEPGASAPVRVSSFSQNLVAGTEYVFVLAESGGLIDPVILEYAPLANDASGSQLVALHAGASLPAVDLYVEAPGTDITAAAPRATLSFGQALGAQAIAAGEYELTLTNSGDAAAVLMTSGPFTLAAAASSTFVILDGANAATAPINVLVVGESGGTLFDKNTQAELRVINGATDTAPRDFVVNDQFTPPLFPAVPFAVESTYLTVPPGNVTLNVTPAGNPGVLELTQTLAIAQNVSHTVLVSGDAGVLTHALVSDSTRRFANDAKLRLLSAAGQFTLIDFFVVPTGTDIATVNPVATLGSPGASGQFTVPPNTYDLVLRHNGTTNIIAGPQAITLEAGGLYGVLAVNGPDTATAGVVLLDDF